MPHTRSIAIGAIAILIVIFLKTKNIFLINPPVAKRTKVYIQRSTINAALFLYLKYKMQLYFYSQTNPCKLSWYIFPRRCSRYMYNHACIKPSVSVLYAHGILDHHIFSNLHSVIMKTSFKTLWERQILMRLLKT